jgi:hypothetical protein
VIEVHALRFDAELVRGFRPQIALGGADLLVLGGVSNGTRDESRRRDSQNRAKHERTPSALARTRRRPVGA